SSVDDVRNAQLFIKALEGATLDESGLDSDTLARLRNPIWESVDISDDKDFRLSLKVFLADTNASEATYHATRDAILEHSPNVDMLSYYSVKRAIESMTGIVPITHDMCPNSCIAY
ncbi:hypothetical protein B0H13DRAFT_1505852, partial [Mycena leptocephala]